MAQLLKIATSVTKDRLDKLQNDYQLPCYLPLTTTPPSIDKQIRSLRVEQAMLFYPNLLDASGKLRSSLTIFHWISHTCAALTKVSPTTKASPFSVWPVTYRTNLSNGMNMPRQGFGNPRHRLESVKVFAGKAAAEKAGFFSSRRHFVPFWRANIIPDAEYWKRSL